MRLNKNSQGIIVKTETLEMAVAFNKKGDRGFFIKGKSKDVLKQLNRLKPRNSLL